MANRRGNMSFVNRNFGGSSNLSGSPNKKSMQNQNRNRPPTGKSNNFGNHSLGNQVNPWLSQSSVSNNSIGAALGRNMHHDQQSPLALASRLLNNLLSPELCKFAQPRPLLSLGRSNPTSSLSHCETSNFNRNRLPYGRLNAGKIQQQQHQQPRDFRRGDFKNKRFGNDRKYKKNDQSNKKSIEQKNVEKKEVVKKEEITVENLDVEQSASEPVAENKVFEGSSLTEAEKQNVGVKKTAPEEPKVSYKDIPSAFLFCHVCRKHMWDDLSFEKHLEGKPHKLMFNELDQSYKLKVELLRHNMRVMEQQRENDIQRAQRKGKSNVRMQQRDFCNMCNLSFLGLLPAHRKNERHQRLKKFLHPKCNICSKEFYTRLEWDDHKLTAAHLKKLAEIRKETRPDLEETELDIIDFIEDINDELDLDNIELRVGGNRESMDELHSIKSEVVENSIEGEDKVKDQVTASSVESQKDDEKEERTLAEGEKIIPKYCPGIPVGENFIIEKTGSLCRACNKFMLTQEDVKIHCQTAVHYNNIVKVWRAQNRIVRKRRFNEESKIEEEMKAQSIIEDGLSVKRPKVAENAEVNVSTTEKEVKYEPMESDDKYDPEHPENENGKDQEKTGNAVDNKTNDSIVPAANESKDANTTSRTNNVEATDNEVKQAAGDAIQCSVFQVSLVENIEINNGTKAETIEVESTPVIESAKIGTRSNSVTRGPRAQRARRGRGRRV